MDIYPPLRGCDKWGCGHFGASRGGRLHDGVDVACYKGSTIRCVVGGKVTRIGFPYSQDNEERKHYRLVEIKDDKGKIWRYLYMDPLVEAGQSVFTGQPIGVSQGINEVYPGMIDHVHIDCEVDGAKIDPTLMIFGSEPHEVNLI